MNLPMSDVAGGELRLDARVRAALTLATCSSPDGSIGADSSFAIKSRVHRRVDDIAGHPQARDHARIRASGLCVAAEQAWRSSFLSRIKPHIVAPAQQHSG